MTDYRSREEAFLDLKDAFTIMFSTPRAEWPSNVEDRRESAERFLRDNPAEEETHEPQPVQITLSESSLEQIRGVMRDTLGALDDRLAALDHTVNQAIKVVGMMPEPVDVSDAVSRTISVALAKAAEEIDADRVDEDMLEVLRDKQRRAREMTLSTPQGIDLDMLAEVITDAFAEKFEAVNASPVSPQKPQVQDASTRQRHHDRAPGIVYDPESGTLEEVEIDEHDGVEGVDDDESMAEEVAPLDPAAVAAGATSNTEGSTAAEADTGSDHDCRANLDVDDICMVCGNEVLTGPQAWKLQQG